MTRDPIEEPMAALMRALDAKDALADDASLEEQLNVAIEGVMAGKAFLQAVAREPAPGEIELAPEVRRAAMRDLLAMRVQFRPLLPDALDVAIDLTLADPKDLDPRITDEDRLDARAILLDNGFLTEGELATFPRESLRSIVRERLARWEETGDARG